MYSTLNGRNNFNQLAYKFNCSKKNYRQLVTEYPCIYCGVNKRCLYKQNINYHDTYRYTNNTAYICETAAEQNEIIKKKMVLFHELSQQYLIEDVNRIIRELMYLVKVDFIQCVKDKETIINYRKNFLASNDFISLLSTEQLKALCIQRNLNINFKLKKKEFLLLLNEDYHKKSIAWRWDCDYPLV